MLRVNCKYVEVMGFNRSKSKGGSGKDSSTGGIPRSWGMRSSGSGFGGLGSSSLSGTGVDVDGACPVLRLENKDLVRLIGVWAASLGAAEVAVEATGGVRARNKLSGEVLILGGFGGGVAVLGGASILPGADVVVVGVVGVAVAAVEMVVG